jgi:hypothetical protein
MRSKILLPVLLTVLFVLASGCGSVRNCPVCGTTLNDGYTIIDIIPVPEHNPTGEPGGPFNSFDISVVDSAHHRFYVSDRIGLDIPVFDTVNKVAVNVISGDNGVAGAGDIPSPCITDAAGHDIIPPLVTGLGNLTRFGCRTDLSTTAGGVFFHIPGFGSSHHLGGFPGAQCCAARANGVNPLSAPDGEAITADGNTLFIANGSSSVVVFDLTTMTSTTAAVTPPTVIADIPTGFSPDYDGCLATPCLTVGPSPSNYPNGAPPAGTVLTGTLNNAGINPCIASANGRAFSDPTCADLRADEMSYDEKDKILLVANGDPGFPFVTLIDVSGVVGKTSHCLPVSASQPYMIQIGTAGVAPVYNFPTCILGQIYYDGAAANNKNVVVDDIGPNSGGAFPCPDPSTSAPSGASGHNGRGAGVDVPCHHGPIISSTGAYCADQTNVSNPTSQGCAGAVALAGLGGSAFNPNSGRFLVTNGNANGNLTVGTIDVINPNIGNPNGPFVENSFLMPNCMPTSVVQGPGNNFLVGCADHDGEAFPPNEYVIDGTSGKILATITTVGGVDETWYNPTDNRYYLAARDMPTGPVLGVIDAKTNQWLQNVPTNANSHSVAVDSGNNHVFVPMQSGGPCGTQSSNGCIGVFAQQ